DGLERGGRLVDGDIKTLGLEVPPVWREEEGRGQSLEAADKREFDAGLRRRRPRRAQRDRRREDAGGPTHPRELEEAHGCSLCVAPHRPRPKARLEAAR